MDVKYGSYIFGFLPHPFKQYRVRNDKVFIKHGFGISGWLFWEFGNETSVEILTVRFDKKIKFPYLFGDILITDGSNGTLTLSNLLWLESKYKLLDGYKFAKMSQSKSGKNDAKHGKPDNEKNYELDSVESSGEKDGENNKILYPKTLERKAIPAHVELSDDVILLPRMPYFLSKILRPYSQYEEIILKRRIDQYTWINKGDVLYSFELASDIYTIFGFYKIFNIEIKSPLSGFLISLSSVDFLEKDGPPEEPEKCWNKYCSIIPTVDYNEDVSNYSLHRELYETCVNIFPKSIHKLALFIVLTICAKFNQFA